MTDKKNIMYSIMYSIYIACLREQCSQSVISLHVSLNFCPEVLCCAEVFVEESHQLFGFLRLLPRLNSLSLHRSSDVLPGCLSLFACDASQLLLYNGLLLLIPEQAHTHSFIYKPVA